MKGKIIRGVGGFYYVFTPDEGIIYACRARGIFRKDGMKPLPGDNVEITVTHEKDQEGSLDRIGQRKNVLIRPAVANVDQALVVFAVTAPEPNFNLLDRFLINMRRQQVPVIICFNKTDLAGPDDARRCCEIYKDSGCHAAAVSVRTGEGLEALRELLLGKTTVVAGPSGVGKSSLTNYLYPQAHREVGEISRKIERGRQTTRHTELIWFAPDSFFIDTPGFSSLYLQDITPEQLPGFYPEFEKYEKNCRFQGCLHISEPDCAVKQALSQGKIARERYDNYLLLARELREQKPKYR